MHKQQLNDTRSSRRTEIITEVDGRLTKEYEEKLQSELQLLRQQAEEDVKRNKQEISELFDSKVRIILICKNLLNYFNEIYLLILLIYSQIQNLENELQRKKKAIEVAQDDINAANSRISDLSSQINNLLASNNEYLVCTTVI